MSQHDMDVANGPGLTFRNDMNAALQALASQSSGASEPSPAFPCQVWADTGAGRLKQRNSANSAWLDMGPLDAALRDAANAGAYAADTGAANAYVCNFTPAITVRSEGTPIRFKAANANTGSCTINDGVGVVALVGGAQAALQGGEIAAGGIAWIQWSTSVGGGSYILLFCTGASEQTADATKGRHAVNADQVQKGVFGAAAAGGTVDAITASYTPAITTLTNGMVLYVRASGANTITTPSFTPNSGTIATKTIVKGNNLPLVAGDIVSTWIELQYDSTLDKWVLTSPATGVTASMLDSLRIDVASASTVNLTAGAPNTRHINITGAVAITGFTVAAGQSYFVRLNGATLTNNANIVTQTGANITTQAGDTCIIRATAANVVEVLNYSRVQQLTQGAAQNATSGTAIDFTGIPAWAKRIKVIGAGISSNGTSQFQLQMGTASGVEATGYESGYNFSNASVASGVHTTGFRLEPAVPAAAGKYTIIAEFSQLSGNLWVCDGKIYRTDVAGSGQACGSKSLSGVLDRIRLTTLNGTDTFDSGSINIMYEG